MRIRGGRVRRGRIGMRRGASTSPTVYSTPLQSQGCVLLPAPGSLLPAPSSEGTLAPRRAYDHIQQEVSYGSPHHSAVAVVQAPGAVGGSEGLTRPGGPGRPAQCPRRRAGGDREGA